MGFLCYRNYLWDSHIFITVIIKRAQLISVCVREFVLWQRFPSLSSSVWKKTRVAPTSPLVVTVTKLTIISIMMMTNPKRLTKWVFGYPDKKNNESNVRHLVEDKKDSTKTNIAEKLIWDRDTFRNKRKCFKEEENSIQLPERKQRKEYILTG